MNRKFKHTPYVAKYLVQSLNYIHVLFYLYFVTEDIYYEFFQDFKLQS